MKIFNLNDKKIFVIGGSGLIGTEVCNLLKILGAKVYNLDIKRNLKLVPNIKFLKFDISKDKLIEKTLNLSLNLMAHPSV